MSDLQYHRVLLKLSGEMLGGGPGKGISGEHLSWIAKEIHAAHELGAQVGIVVGGGNIFRGSTAKELGMERAAADYIGMLGTVINGLALQAILENRYGVFTRVMTAINMASVAEPYIRRKAVKHLERGRVVIFAAGTGNPYFTTDTGAALRAIEIGADIILKATKVDGIYDSDPMKNPEATKFEDLTYTQCIEKRLDVMDATSMTMCRDAKMPILVFKLTNQSCIKSVLQGNKLGTLVTEE